MLEFFFDAHTHCVPLSMPIETADYRALYCATNRLEWENQNTSLANNRYQALRSFGVHPKDCGGAGMEGITFLNTLLDEGYLDAVGEAGFDFGVKGSRQDNKLVERQEALWQAQVELAIRCDKPLVVHCVHALDRMFRDSKLLSQVKAVVFHAFAGNREDAISLLRHGINAYFSFGTRLMASGKTADCAREVPLDRMLLETDSMNGLGNIMKIYNTAAAIRCISMNELCANICRSLLLIGWGAPRQRRSAATQ